MSKDYDTILKIEKWELINRYDLFSEPQYKHLYYAILFNEKEIIKFPF